MHYQKIEKVVLWWENTYGQKNVIFFTAQAQNTLVINMIIFGIIKKKNSLRMK